MLDAQDNEWMGRPIRRHQMQVKFHIKPPLHERHMDEMQKKKMGSEQA